MEIEEAVKENIEQLVICKAKSANPGSSVGMELFVDGTKQRQIKPEITEITGSNNGIIKSYVFRFIADRNKNKKIVRCRLLWDGGFIKIKKDGYLNITCE